MINTVRKVVAEDVEILSEVDFDGDEYGDNEKAIYSYAKVLGSRDWYVDGDPWISLITDQGTYNMPAGHLVKVKVDD